MSVSEIERVKQDIATIKEAAGLELPFGWESVWLNLIGLPCVGLWCLLYWWIFHTPSLFMIVPPAILILVAERCLRLKYRRSASRSAIRDRQYRVAVCGTIFISGGIGGFVLWAMLADGDIVYLASGLITMVGLMGTLMAFQSKARLSNLGIGIPALLGGISIVIWPAPDAIIWIACIGLFVAGPATALIMMYQLKQAEQANDAD